MFHEINTFRIEGETHKTSDTYNHPTKKLSADRLEIVIRTVEFFLGESEYIVQFSIDGQEFYTELLSKSEVNDVKNRFNNKGDRTGIELLKFIFIDLLDHSGYFSRVYQVFHVSNHGVTKNGRKKHYLRDLISSLWNSLSILGSSNATQSEDTNQDTAQTWLQWCQENPGKTALAIGAAGAIGYGAYWAYHKYLYPPQEQGQEQEPILHEADEFPQEQPADNMAGLELQAEFEPEFDDGVDFSEEELVAELNGVLENDDALDDDNQDDILDPHREPQAAFEERQSDDDDFEEQQQSILYSELLGRLGAFQNVAEHLEQASKDTVSRVNSCLSVFN